jgi:tetratricopeptide (TPR) repeat protein/transglutaminase-like putative cysteine protease
LRFSLLAAFCFAATLSLFAADQAASWDSPHFSLEPQALYAAASAAKPPEGTDIAVLVDEESYVFDAGGSSVHTQHLIYKVLTQRGAQSWDSIACGWEPWHQQRPVVRVRVVTPDFSVHELDPATIIDGSADEGDARLYSDRRIVRAPLPAIAPGSVIEEELVINETAPLFSAGSAASFFVGHYVPVQHSRLVLEAPSAVPLHYVTQLLPDSPPQRREADGRTTLTFEYGPLPPVDPPETNLPSDAPALPMITFTTGASWQAVAEAYYAIVDKTIRGADLKTLVHPLLQGKHTRNEKIQALMEYLDKEVRYTGIEFGANAIMPHSPSEVLAHKYGDCKDKATLLVAMLQAADIPAYVALLHAGSRLDVPPDLPGMGLFDHAIVYVPGKPDLWIDATDVYARMGQLPAPDQDRLSLVVRPDSKALVHTPQSPSRDNVLLETRDIYLADNGPARVVETSHPGGSFESEYRHLYADKQNKQVFEYLTSYMKAQYLADKLDRFEPSAPDNLSEPFSAVLESKKSKRGYTDLDDAVAAIRLEGLFTRLPAELQQRESDDDTANAVKPKKKRTADYELPLPFVAEWHYNVFPPAGFQPKPLPHDEKLALGPALLTEQFSAGPDGVVHAVFRFDTVKRRYTVAEATQMRNQIAGFADGEAVLISFEPVGEALLKQGKVKESFQSYRALIARQPQAAVHHLQMAKVLLEAGMGDAARDEARLAVKLEPGSALAEKTLAEILEYDLVGRKLRPGSDYAGAAAAFRAAAKLDPDDKDIVENLAILLEYNQDGVRYGSGADLKGAIAQYRSLSPEKLAELGLQNNLAYALFYSGDFAEARKYAETLNPQPKPLIVACEAVVNGSKAGLAEANKRSNGDEEFKQTVGAAGQMLMNVRKYSVAADFMEAGAAGDNTARTMGLASLLRKARPHEELRFGNDPAGLAMKFSLLFLDPNLTVEKVSALLSRNAQAVLKDIDPEELENLLKPGKESNRSMARSGGSPDVAIDLLMQSVEPKGEGNDSSGYREKLQIPGGKNMTIFVVKENGEYKALDTADNPNAIGLEILDRIAARNLDGARVLLDWIREEQHLEGGDDPLSGEAFPRFWTKGKEADAAQMKLAAAAILVQSKPTAKQGIAILEEAAKSAAGDSEQTNIDLALLTGYVNLDNYEGALAVAARLAKKEPESKRVFLTQTFALCALGRFDEANQLTQQRLKRLPDDVDALRELVRVAFAREDYRAAYDLSRKLVQLGKADASDLNGLAWLTLFLPETEKPDIESAIQATQLSQNNPHILHTLGCLYAAAGKTKEAREVLVQAMDVQNLDEPDPDFWYAFGRIAEQYGEIDIAKADYTKVSKPKHDVQLPGSSYRLAQIRLKQLAEK